MEIGQYLGVIRKWWWLMVACVLVAAASSYVGTLDMPRIYQATTTLMVGQALNTPNPNTQDFWVSQQLALTYVDIVRRRPILEGAALALGLMGEEGARADLERLAKDPAYLLRPEPGSERFRVVYPVRVAACAALSRFGVAAEPGGGVFDKKALRGATRGGSNKTNDYGDVRRDIVSRVPLFEDE